MWRSRHGRAAEFLLLVREEIRVVMDALVPGLVCSRYPRQA